MNRVFALILLAVAACYQPVSQGATGSGAAGASAGGGSSGTGGAGASATPISATRHAPEVMFVLDRSGSMTEPPGNNASQSKWSILESALLGAGGYVKQLQDTLTAQSGEDAPVGLVLFPQSLSDSSPAAECAPGTVAVAPTSSASGPIANALDGNAPGGATPTAASLLVAGDALSDAQSAGRSAFIILLTDGAPNCNANWNGNPDDCQDKGADPSAGCTSAGCCFQGSNRELGCTPLGCLDRDNSVASATKLQGEGIETFIIGFGSDLADASSLASQTLQSMATAGGSKILYRAMSSADLSTALGDVLTALQNQCEFTLASAAPNSFTTLVLQADGHSQSIDASHVSLSADRMRAAVDDVACASVPGHSATLAFR